MKGKVKIVLMIFLEVSIFSFLLVYGYSYYSTTIEQRYFHPDNIILKSSGFIGHGLGIFGALLIVTGVFTYMARKRIRQFSKYGLMKNWLVFHIFLCSLGAILVLFHTTFKFGGIIAAGFWSMVVVVVSGITGRFIYIQIPRTIEGRELSLQELHEMQKDIGKNLRNRYKIEETLFEQVELYERSKDDNNLFYWIIGYFKDLSFFRKLNKEVGLHHLSRKETRNVIKLFREEIILNQRIRRLSAINKLFRNWHIVHLPFALIMLVIMMIHVVVVIVFGFKWIL
jgi:hypothetical protein